LYETALISETQHGTIANVLAMGTYFYISILKQATFSKTHIKTVSFKLGSATT